ncbi:DNA/RNA helicase domain-containing protein [Rhodococcus sp. NPDC058521]|uniref:DNA/RNA helicase domain-containing protein n=1 Tax=Rhodococcus sp. NPDC058521 TaxID=3346536 RepID=UPI00364CA983
MTLLRTSANHIAGIAHPDSLAEQLLEKMLFSTGRRASPAEQKSWSRSLPVFARDLADAGLGDIEMLVEYHMPLTSQRADVVLAGTHPDTGAPSYVVVELKQWSSAYRFENNADLVEVPGMPGGPKLHPVAQVKGYCDYLADFAKAIADQPDALAGMAYLHNATDPAMVADLRAFPTGVTGRLFTAADRSDMIAFLRTRLATGSTSHAAGDTLMRSAVAPSQQLLKVAAAEVRERPQFHLLGNQQLAVDLVLHAVEQARSSDSKRVIIVTGGPGSGKSVIALSLVGELARRGRTVLHATGSRSFTMTLRKVAGRRAPRVQKMFKYFNQFMTAERNGLDVLILDEAHRIRETSVDRYTKAELRTDRPQIDELIAAARVPVFLLDEHQVVRPGEMGSLEQVQKHAASLGLEAQHVHLDEQFRCGGSEEYLLWVKRLLGLVEGGPYEWKGDPQFQVRVAETPQEVEHLLSQQIDRGYSARITAGYCWPWSNARDDGSLVPDVAIGDWARPWNSKSDRRIGDAPPAPLWATEDGGFDQVGCVYTAQGFEYDWNGVIIGPDLVWRDGRFTTIRDANRDPDFKNRTKIPDPRFDKLVRNVYKVLLTRGMVGTVIYSTDEQTRKALRALIDEPR